MADLLAGSGNIPQEKVFVNPDHSSQVLYQLSELWRDKKFCDASIEVGPVKVYVHRLVLVAACPYLLSVGGQYESPMLEVKLPITAGLDGLNVFLTYLYDGVLNLTAANLQSVEKLAQMLNVKGILKFCQEFRDLYSKGKKENVCEKSQTDYRLNMTESSLQIIFAEILPHELKRESLDFDAGSDTTSVKKTPRTQTLSNQQQVRCTGQQAVTPLPSNASHFQPKGSKSKKTAKKRKTPDSSFVESSDNKSNKGDPSEGVSVVHIKREPTSDTEDNSETNSENLSHHDFGQHTDMSSDMQDREQTDDNNSGNTPSENVSLGQTFSNVDSNRVVKNIVSSMPEIAAAGLGTSSEVDEDNQPRALEAKVMSQASKCRHNLSVEDQESHQALKKKQAAYMKKRRAKWNDVEKEKNRKASRLRMQKMREKKKLTLQLSECEKPEACSVKKTKSEAPKCLEEREKQREYKRKWRSNLSDLKKRIIREKDAAQKRVKRSATKLPLCNKLYEVTNQS